MPLHEYTCSKCRQDFELLVFGNQVPRCPRCGGEKLTRHMSVPAVAHSAETICPGTGKRCRQEPTSCCAAQGCCH